MKDNSYPDKLTNAEAARLRAFVQDHGGYEKTSGVVGVSGGTLNRTAHRHTAPTPLFREKLAELGIIKA